MLALVGPQKGHRRFLADPLGVSPDISVENQVANDQNARISDTASSRRIRSCLMPRVLPYRGNKRRAGETHQISQPTQGPSP